MIARDASNGIQLWRRQLTSWTGSRGGKKAGPVQVNVSAEPPRSLRKGVAVNLLNPHVYLFWGTVGVPLMVRFGGGSSLPAWAFAVAFFVCLVGGKVGVAWLVGRSRHRLEGPGYRWVMRGLSLVLGGFGLMLLRDGAVLIGHPGIT